MTLSTKTETLLVFLGLMALVLSPALAQDDDEIDANPELIERIDETIGESFDEGLDELIEMLGRGEVDDPEYMDRRLDPDEGPVQYPAANSELIDQGCERGAIQHAVEHLGEEKGLSRDEALKMGMEHTADRNRALAEGITYREYIEHVAECKAFCRDMVKQLVACHVEAVSQLGPEIALFAFDSADLGGSETYRAIDQVVARANGDSSKRVLLIGRASRIGPKAYNRLLSGRRAEAIRSALLERGVDEHRIYLQGFGYEEPQIDEVIAAAYGWRDLYRSESHSRMNQSVVMVVF